MGKSYLWFSLSHTHRNDIEIFIIIRLPDAESLHFMREAGYCKEITPQWSPISIELNKKKRKISLINPEIAIDLSTQHFVYFKYKV